MKRLLIAAATTTLPTAAFAHTGHFDSATFASGFTHPLLGLDHLTAMIAVGVWAQLVQPKRVWVWPLTFVAAMIAGAVLAGSGLEIPAVEPLILASLFAVGLAILFNAAAPIGLGGAAIALFAIAHGYAHGAEAPAGSGIAYMAGFSCATILLHITGIGLARAATLAPAPLTVRALGLVPIAVGLALAAR